MEKKYITPEIDITEFEVEDLLTTSGCPPDGNNQGNGEDKPDCFDNQASI